jgi:hypothetical protein
VFVADALNHRVRRISPTGHVTTFAGNGTPGLRDGPGPDAMFNGLSSANLDSGGNIYVTDYLNRAVRKIDPAGNVTTVAGTGVAGLGDGPAGVATFTAPMQAVAAGGGRVYVTDIARVRVVESSGTVSTLADLTGLVDTRGGCCAPLDFLGLAFDPGFGLVTAGADAVLRSVAADGTPGVFAGSVPGHADGPRLSARFGTVTFGGGNMPRMLASGGGGFYVCDGSFIRHVDATGFVTTLATRTPAGIAGPSPLGYVSGVCVDRAGVVYVSDLASQSVWKLLPDRDFDGIPDAEEGGTTPYTVGVDDRLVDTDGDGASNGAEYVAGTNPRDRTSALRVVALAEADGKVSLHWQSVVGRVYGLEASSDLLQWESVGAPVGGTGGELSAKDAPTAARYYRLAVSRP